MEERLQEIKWNFVGKTGTLTIDADTDQEKVFTDITLDEVSVPLEEFNDSMEYELSFSFPLSSGGGTEIARTLEFDGTKLVNADNFIVEWTKEDRTVFKPVFRAAAMRVPAGPGLSTIRIQALKDGVTGASALIKRQAIEAEILDWNDNYVGEEGDLEIDAISVGTCHLRSVSPSDLTLPDALVYELEFVTGYGA
jgi:hypothetical protein